ncbi:MAG: aminotransferase class I/II-fold pyridoxal phosphate-dependent enzyme [Dehalococcoidia bacterium]|nr:aminotransferase class I/II-fold pyridoxal phosphate-dependent enzyme [Dehalococcoidia bacterium]
MNFAKRVQQLPPYLFVQISQKIAEKRAKGEEVISFGIGDPDIPTPPHVVERLRQAALKSANHRYPESDGLPEFKRAAADWFQKRFGIALNADKEVVSLIGAKEGIGHAALCFIDPGDVALVPDPGYPVYSIGTMFAGGTSHWLPLREENGWLVDLDAIPSDVARSAKVLWLNYPNNPTGAVADLRYMEKAVAFGKRYNIPVLHDAAYSEVTFDGYKAPSIMQVPGAKDVAIEFHSLSKMYNMTGWRLGFAVGNPDMINALFRVKSNLDSGVPQAIQEMGIEALSGPQDAVANNCRIYQRRRDKLAPVLREIGLRFEMPRASLYLWARVPEGYTSAGFAATILDQKGIVVTPGNGFGPNGEGYVRLSMTTADENVDKAVQKLKGWKVPPPPAKE